MSNFEFQLLTEFHLLRFAAIFILGLGAQWVAWRFRIPALLLLLVIGFLAGPATNFLQPDVLFGDLLSPIIAVGVGVILFESSLELQLNELKKNPNSLSRLIFIGSLITFAGAAVAAKIFLSMRPSIAALIGAISVVSGPAVIIPLLRETPLKGSLGSIVRWEGSALETIGALIALLTFEVTYGLAESASARFAIWNIAKTLLVGGGMGGIATILILSTIRSMQIPDSLKGGICVGSLLLCFAVSYRFVPESGLLTTIVAGLLLGNQRLVTVQRYLEFGDVLRIPLFSALFIVLAARIPIESLREFSHSGWLFIFALIFVVRPVAVFVSTIGSDISLKEKFFLSLFAPRGAVAGAVASLFALDLLDLGYPDAGRVVPLTFFIIISTVGVYGLSAPLVARLFDLAELTPRGVLILGAHDWGREIAKTLMQSGLRVLVVDSNHYNILSARREGIPSRCENIFVDHSLDEVILDGIKHFVAITSNNEVNTLASLHFAELFGPGEVYQLASRDRAPMELPSRTRRYQNQILFGNDITFEFLEEKFNAGWKVRLLNSEELLTTPHSLEELIVLFVVLKNGQFLPATADIKLGTPPGTQIVVFASPELKIANNSRVIQFERPKR